MSTATKTDQRKLPTVERTLAAWKATKRENVEPHADSGFFGPGSVAWKVWSHPTGLTIGFQRAVVVEELDPNLVAAVDATSDIYRRPRTRYDRTIRYFAMVAFGGSESVLRAANVLVKVHSKAVGVDPVIGGRYDANDPDSQLWILLTGWHSVLYAYEMYGPGKLSAEEEREYWRACATAAELQTCDPADVPRTREALREYYEYTRPSLRGSEIAVKAMRHLLNGQVMLPPTPAALAPARWLGNQVLRAATIATLPMWMRKTAGLRQPRWVDPLVAPPVKIAVRVAHRFPRLGLMALTVLSPSTVPIAAPVLHGVPAVNPAVLTPEQARELHGYSKPADAHAEWRARQVELMLAGKQTSDEGLIESQAVLGALA